MSESPLHANSGTGRRHSRRGWRPLALLGLVATAVLATGCRSAPPPMLEETSDRVVARIVASPDVNPSAAGRPSPVHVRIFQLREEGEFLGADFWSLVDKQQETLGASRLQHLELDLVPGEVREIEIEIAPEARVLGVMAEFANYRNAQWRTVAPVATLQRTVKSEPVPEAKREGFFKRRSLPKAEIPKAEMPKPEIPKPAIPKPQIPKAKLPKAKLPKAQIPKAQIPKAQIPKAQIPKAQIPKPELPKAQIPKAEIPKPQIPKPQIPKSVGLPKSPGLPKSVIPKSEDVLGGASLPATADALPTTEGVLGSASLPKTEDVLGNASLPKTADVVGSANLPTKEDVLGNAGLPKTDKVLGNASVPKAGEVLQNETPPRAESTLKNRSTSKSESLARNGGIVINIDKDKATILVGR